MTPYEKDAVRRMRENGGSYGQIASTLGLSENTVKSLCRREGILVAPESSPRCPHCSNLTPSTSHGTRRRYCSDTCRYAWNFAHRVLGEKNAVSRRCACCGKTFFSYPSSGRKYCSRACYIRDRFGKEARRGSRTV